MTELLDDGTLVFLPGRLNSQPVIMGGLTADEMWTTLVLSIAAGLVVGIPAALLTQIWALIIAGAMLGAVLGLGIASRVLRRMKRGRPDTWVYRQMQLALVRHVPAWSNARLITRTGAWTCHRSEVK
ncbi:TIGR03750 family conjugal transfer protein [Pseudomonas sp. FSL R10-1350]|uniref:TIGR03750 family conjugal transfer protein n=1 Tax=Pseudomonas sp. FSL R10-1350 TaxID=2662197 RepID=UPI0012975A68|nr:TIGR03750 family conjugal transfer protein [Pseudomonas sp. FSL R10-1350]MQU62318.1 TIGR03750 family conjugal transfer protein [Pseudomonas sp. FSL R10-1350]